MERKLIRTAFAAAVLLCGCEGTGRGSGTSPGATGASAPVSPSPSGGVASLPATLPADFVVSTNEPFWQARVDGGEVLLDGPEVEGRRFVIDTRQDADGARAVVARDAGGSITVRLSPGPCQDSMSGAEFPFAGELEIDGAGPAHGCARPAHMPPPRPSGD